MEPFTLVPYVRPMVWGGRRLIDALSKSAADLTETGAYGESWELSGHPHHVSRVAAGDHCGESLADLVRDHGLALFGLTPFTADPFPLLVKFLDCRGWLSVQVHPDDERAGPLAGEAMGKSEAWIVLEAAPEGQIYAGVKPGVDRAALERAVAEGRVIDCLHEIKPRPGDCVYLPAGTVHAVGGGVLLAEVQQSSDATFRLYDWRRSDDAGRPRPLHIPQALECINWTQGPVEPTKGRPLPRPAARVDARELVRGPYFHLDRYDAAEPFLNPYPGRFTVWMILAGRAALESLDGRHRERYETGTTVVAP
ncbi:MAG: type I phosphomannose isomerase catalytic subunit, partial [Planctomycetia bacterium]